MLDGRQLEAARVKKMAVLWLLLLALPVCAQITTGSVSGYVFDPSGRPISNAEVRAIHSTQAATRSSLTGADGFYRITGLAPALYSVRASAKDFDAAVAGGVRVAVNTEARADLTLAVTGLRQSAEVKAAVSLLPLSSPELSTVLDAPRIESLPLNRRSFLQLALLAPGVTTPTEDSELSARGSFAMHAAGAREEHNNFLIDGVDNNDAYISTFAIQPPVDSIQEFKLATSVYSAEYGRSAGGQVNIVTRSGGNQFHGAAYEYLRNRVLDSRNFFDGPSRPKLIRNQFGAALGGPLRKERTFFYLNAEALRERRGLSRLATVPGAAGRSGDFSASATPVLDPFTRQPFPGNRIPASRFSRLAPSVLALFPPANLPGSSGNYLAQSTQRESFGQAQGRIDHRLSAADQVMFRYSYGNQDLFEPYTEELTLVPGFGDYVANRSHNLSAQHTRAFSPSLFHSFRFGYVRTYRDVRPQNYATDVGQKWGVGWLNVRPRDFGYPLVNVAGLSAAGDAAQLPISRANDTFQAVEGLSWVRGAHSVKAGGEFRYLRLDGYLDYYARGSLTFSGAVSATGLSDLLLGFPSFGLQATFDNRQSMRSAAWAAYAQDDWKLSRTFTLSLGLRYEFVAPPTDPEDRMSVYNPATGSVLRVGTQGIPRAGIRDDRNNFAPRAGFAWTPAADWVVRGGYGLYYDSGMFVVNSSNYFNPPYFTTRIYFPTAASLITLDNPFPAQGGVTPAPSPNTLSPDITSAYLQQWNFSLERQMGGATTVRAAYAGSKGTHLIRSRDLNQPPPGPGAVQTRRPNPAVGSIFFIESAGNSAYHSLQLSLDRRLAKGLSALVSYTRAKSIDDASAFLGTKADKNFPQDSRNIRGERALSSFDAPHRLVGAVTYAPAARSRWMRGFELRAIATAQSGLPFTPILRFDNSNTGNTGGIFGSDRPNLLRSPALDAPSPERWFDTSAFALAPRYQFGNAGRNVVRGAGILNFDAALSRRFALRDRWTLTADLESFNLLNRAQFDLPERFADEPGTFGRIFSAKPARQLQLALRLSW
jgi:hypothetical protein